MKDTIKIPCLKCRKPFDSEDKITNRLCDKCRKSNMRVWGDKTVKIGGNMKSKKSKRSE